jgi:sec-independent protein translocase protein TatC
VAVKKTKNKLTKKHTTLQHPSNLPAAKAAFAEHLKELRKRLFAVVAFVLGFSVLAYSVQHQITALLLRPAKNQQFIYTTPGGGIDFLLKVCLYTGVVLSIPVIIYHLLKYLQPLIKEDALRFVRWGCVVSGFLAIAGVLFGYFLGLPAALHFLLNQFSNAKNGNIEALISIQSYMSFILLYMVGSALIFQIPLVLILINRIKPLNPKTLLKHERWVILLSVIAAGIVNPSPNITDQLALAVPMILTYQIGIFLIWRINNKNRRSKSILQMIEEDKRLQEERLKKFELARIQTAKALTQARS